MNTSLEKKLVIVPAKLEGEQYKEYELKAQVTNVPLSNTLFYWDWDEGAGFQDLGWKLRVIFKKNGIHNVRVRAVDIFSEEVLGYDSIRVDIRPPSPFVEISPKFLDTIMAMDPDGKIRDYLHFNVKTSIASRFIYTEWDYDDGSNKTSAYSHHFLRSGAFTVRAKVFDEAGTYIGSDSAKVMIRMPPFTATDIVNAKKVAVWLSVDPGHPLTADPLFVNPLALEIPPIRDVHSKIDASGFRLFLLDTAYSSGPIKIRSHLYLDTIIGTISPDLQSIPKVAVSVNDTGFQTYNARLQYRFTLENLQLLAVTDNQIIYRTVSPLTTDFIKDLYFFAVNTPNLPRGSLPSTATLPITQADPFGLVVFQR